MATTEYSETHLPAQAKGKWYPEVNGNRTVCFVAESLSTPAELDGVFEDFDDPPETPETPAKRPEVLPAKLDPKTQAIVDQWPDVPAAPRQYNQDFTELDKWLNSLGETVIVQTGPEPTPTEAPKEEPMAVIPIDQRQPKQPDNNTQSRIQSGSTLLER